MESEDAKLLTEKLLGECYHEWRSGSYRKGKGGYGCCCDKCDALMYTLDGEDITDNRTFDTPDDMMAVKDKLVEKGEHYKFVTFCHTQWINTETGKYEDFINWILIPARFCQLACDFMKEGEDG